MTKLMEKQLMTVLIIIIIATIIANVYLFFESTSISRLSKDYKDKDVITNVNDYEYIAITNIRIGKIYYAEFFNLLRLTPKEAYNKLNNYSKKKYKTYESFKKHVDKTNYRASINKVLATEKNGLYTYTVYDIKNNIVRFKSTSIMDYKIDL